MHHFPQFDGVMTVKLSARRNFFKSWFYVYTCWARIEPFMQLSCIYLVSNLESRNEYITSFAGCLAEQSPISNATRGSACITAAANPLVLLVAEARDLTRADTLQRCTQCGCRSVSLRVVSENALQRGNS